MSVNKKILVMNRIFENNVLLKVYCSLKIVCTNNILYNINDKKMYKIFSPIQSLIDFFSTIYFI